jgi:hypothetical protein
MSLSVAGVVAVVVIAYVTHETIGEVGLRALSDAAAPIGWWIAAGAAGVLVVDVAALATYTIRYGEPEGDNDSAGDPAISPSLSNIPFTALSKVKMLGRRSGYVSTGSLVDGTATFGERMMVLGIVALFISFFLIFVGFSLLLAYVPLLALVFPIIPGVWVFVRLREMWRDYRRAKEKVRGGSDVR